MVKKAPEKTDDRIPVIDLFAGPGGLGEGFASHSEKFRIVLSVEKDKWAHETLELRAFYRQFPKGPPDEYYKHVAINDRAARLADRSQLFAKFPEQAAAARFEACRAELGEPDGEAKVRKRLGKIQRDGTDLRNAILIGGPPCQAYSVVGRSRRAKDAADGTYDETEDPRHQLYRWYLQILSEFQPAAFVMENVRGILSSKYEGDPIFPKIRTDLEQGGLPQVDETQSQSPERIGYQLFSLNPPERDRDQQELNSEEAENPVPPEIEDTDFVVHADEHGVPQKRVRVFIVGLRKDLASGQAPRLRPREQTTVREMLCDLPKLRSGLSKSTDTSNAWATTVKNAATELVERESLDSGVCRSLAKIVERERFAAGRGSEAIPVKSQRNKNKQQAPEVLKWVTRSKLLCILNHETRGHIAEDLKRYLFAAAYGEAHRISPSLRDYPESILPLHKNVQAAKRKKKLATAKFADRFRVQVADRPATTITSHIGKDGHYYIHYDPAQCRSLTVREAARLQTFPDDYLFCGPRTEQYKQVGNAVPPYLARQIAEALSDSLDHQVVDDAGEHQN